MRGEQYLNEPEQFAVVYDKGASWVNKILVIKALPNGLALSRFGISVSSRVGGAVVRNRTKRRLREIIRRTRLIPGWDIIIIARPAAARVNYAALKESIGSLFFKAKLMPAAVN